MYVARKLTQAPSWSPSNSEPAGPRYESAWHDEYDEAEFEGYASLFNVPDLNNDVVMKNAFRDGLRTRGHNVKMLWQHDPCDPIGVWREIGEDDKGLFVRGALNLKVAKAREICELVISGAIDGLSIGFNTQKASSYSRKKQRRLEKVNLWEISLVTFPMLPCAKISKIKKIHKNENKEENVLSILKKIKKTLEK